MTSGNGCGAVSRGEPCVSPACIKYGLTLPVFVTVPGDRVAVHSKNKTDSKVPPKAPGPNFWVRMKQNCMQSSMKFVEHPIQK